jgi:hypothetical protein
MKKVWIFGDSISADYSPKSDSYQQSWAHFLREHLTDDVEYKNVAVAGSTLKWFCHCDAYKKGEAHENKPEESLWYKIVSEVSEGDFFIFFIGGTNDHGQVGGNKYFPCENGDYILDDFQKLFNNVDRYLYVGEGNGTHRYYTTTSTIEEFTEILEGMINQVKAKGAIPIMLRGTGKYYMRNEDNFDAFPASHLYMAALPALCEKTKVEYLDIGGIFDKGFKEKGYKYMMDNYFMTINAYKMLNEKCGNDIPRDWNDNCHHNLEGGKHICSIFMEEIKRINHPLKNHLK